jgi:hypothetical protein
VVRKGVFRGPFSILGTNKAKTNWWSGR